MHKAAVELVLALPKIKGLSIQSAFSTTGINRNECFLDDDGYDKRFNAFLPSILFTSSKITMFNIRHGLNYPPSSNCVPGLTTPTLICS